MKSVKLLWLSMASFLVFAPAAARAESLLEKIGMAILADRFGVDTSQVAQLQQQTGLSVYNLAPTYQASYYFKRDPNTIRRLRDQGLGWGEIAKRIGMQPGEFNKLRNQGAFDSNHFWDSSCQNRFGVSAQQIKTMRQNGGSHESILGSCVVGKLSKKDPQTIYQQFQDQRSWTTITRQNSVRFESWRRVSQPDRDSNRVSWSGKKIKPGAWTRVSPAKQKHRPIKARTDKGHGKPDKVKADHDQRGHGDKQKGNDSKSKGKGKGKSKGR